MSQSLNSAANIESVSGALTLVEEKEEGIISNLKGKAQSKALPLFAETIDQNLPWLLPILRALAVILDCVEMLSAVLGNGQRVCSSASG
jgi:hypothetical protein